MKIWKTSSIELFNTTNNEIVECNTIFGEITPWKNNHTKSKTKS